MEITFTIILVVVESEIQYKFYLILPLYRRVKCLMLVAELLEKVGSITDAKTVCYFDSLLKIIYVA